MIDYQRIKFLFYLFFLLLDKRQGTKEMILVNKIC
jgi:hypothetical protein